VLSNILEDRVSRLHSGGSLKSRVLIMYRRFGTSCWSNFRGPSLKMGPICCPETSVQSCQSTLRNVPEERRFHRTSFLTKPSRIISFTEVVAVYSENRLKHTVKVCIVLCCKEEGYRMQCDCLNVLRHAKLLCSAHRYPERALLCLKARWLLITRIINPLKTKRICFI
jgi:hypothetical protein